MKDASGAIWLTQNAESFQIDKSEVDRWWLHPTARVAYQLLDESDGAQPGLTSLKPQAVRTPDGRLWFVNSRILQMFDPIQSGTGHVPPPVHIEEVIADRPHLFSRPPHLSSPPSPATFKSTMRD